MEQDINAIQQLRSLMFLNITKIKKKSMKSSIIKQITK